MTAWLANAMLSVMTLKQFVAKCGSQERAAQKIGVSWATVNRWLNGQRKPRGLSIERLAELGVRL